MEISDERLQNLLMILLGLGGVLLIGSEVIIDPERRKAWRPLEEQPRVPDAPEAPVDPEPE